MSPVWEFEVGRFVAIVALFGPEAIVWLTDQDWGLGLMLPLARIIHRASTPVDTFSWSSAQRLGVLSRGDDDTRILVA
jgi:hypothetical protein